MCFLMHNITPRILKKKSQSHDYPFSYTIDPDSSARRSGAQDLFSQKYRYNAASVSL